MGEETSRKYTPVSPIHQKKKFDLLIKIYHKDTNPKFPEGGLMTQWLDRLNIGATVIFRGPIGRMIYYGDGLFKLGTKEKPIKWSEKKYNKVGMLCGGTGIAPFFQILQAADSNNDTIEFSLIFGNKTSKDILLRNELDTFYKNQNFKFNVQYTINHMEEGWNGLVGHITKDKIETFLPPPADDVLVLLCGRGSFSKKYLSPLLVEMGYQKENIFIF